MTFISYRRGESAGYAGRLQESLERRLGKGTVFRDVDDLDPGQDFVDAIAARLRDCRACLVLIGRQWLRATDAAGRNRLALPDDYVRLEIEAALARSDLLIVPVLVEGATMPTADDLPATIRPLSRRQALSLRDESWDADIDRLVTALDGVTPPAGLPKVSGHVLAWGALALVLIAAAAFLMTRRDPADRVTNVVENAGGYATARAFIVPALGEIAHGQLIYTILSGDIASNGSESSVRLRIRLSNHDSSPTNFWDSTFRLAVQGQVFAATGGLNDMVPGHTIQQAVIRFDVPVVAARAVLHVAGPDSVAELPLDLKTTAAPSEVDRTDSGDALSRAQIVHLLRNAVPLVGGREITSTLSALTARRFVNTLRIIATVRVTNSGSYPWLFGADAFRLVVEGQAIAPVEFPSDVVAAAASISGDFTFDAPPSTTRGALRATGPPQVDVPFEVPSLRR